MIMANITRGMADLMYFHYGDSLSLIITTCSTSSIVNSPLYYGIILFYSLAMCISNKNAVSLCFLFQNSKNIVAHTARNMMYIGT